MAQTMNNIELTRAFQLLQGQIQHLENRLGSNKRKVEQDVATVMAAANSMSEALKAEVQPEVDKITPIMNAISNLQNQITAHCAMLEKAKDVYSDLVQRRGECENKVNQLIPDSKQTHDAAQ